jgi:hypothetical protein
LIRDLAFHLQTESETDMGILLLHDPRIQFYLLFVGALWIAVIWDYLCRRAATKDARAPGTVTPPGARQGSIRWRQSRSSHRLSSLSTKQGERLPDPIRPKKEVPAAI